MAGQERCPAGMLSGRKAAFPACRLPRSLLRLLGWLFLFLFVKRLPL